MTLRYVVAGLAIAALGTATPGLRPRNAEATAQPPRTSASYLFAWAGDEDRQESDFLAVIDLRPERDAFGPRYGTVVRTLPVGESSLWPHHTEHELPASRQLFANGFAANRNLIFDLRRPLAPTVTARFSGVGGLSFLHSFTRLPNGHVLATFQGHGDDNQTPGGLAELDARGQLVQSVSVADSAADQATLRPYSLAVVPALDRVVIGLTFMPIPRWAPARASIEHDHRGDQVQVRRLSDLSLIATIKLPTADGANEPRLLGDGRTVLVNTVACRLYRVTGLEGAAPGLALVHDAQRANCGTPVVVGSYWIQANAGAQQVFALDVRDHDKVRMTSQVVFDARQSPHWVASDGSRIIVSNEPTATSERRLWMLRLDQATGRLTIDSAFRDAGGARPGVSFERAAWPHGASGSAVPHAVVFSR